MLGNARVHLGLKSFLDDTDTCSDLESTSALLDRLRRSPSESGGATLVTMVQTADLRDLNDTSCFQCLNRSRAW
jgi:hypothetical protein